MNSKLIYLVVLLVSVQILLYACCKTFIHTDFITMMYVKNSDGEYDLHDKAEINQEDFRINCRTFLKTESEMASVSFLVNDAYAHKCPYDEFRGIKNHIVTVNVYCNKEIWGIKPGNPINVDDNIMVYYKMHEDSSSQILSIDDWKRHFRNYGYRVHRSNEEVDYDSRPLNSYFVIQKEITSNEYLKFYFNFELYDKTKINAGTKEVKIN